MRACEKLEYYDSGLLSQKRNYRHESTYLLDTYILTYFADGNIASVDNNNVVTSYIYDTAGRLTSETTDGTLQASYTYDAFGNRATMTEPDRVTTYVYNKNNRLLHEGTYDNDDNYLYYHYYDYDKVGNLIEDHDSGTAYGYSYNLFSNLIRAYTENYVTIATYTYDGSGLRTSKTVGNTTTNFINDGAYVVGEVSGDSIIKYTYGTGLISINNNGIVGYYHTDEHGNVSAISNLTREIVADYDFDAFGNETVSTDSYYNLMRYCGEYYDAESRYTYLRARYYDSSIGRFISEDPIKDGTNWYVYCGNNPVKYVDPTGLRTQEETDKIIQDNASYIISAAQEFGIDPGILAATIYAEQRSNVDWKDDYVDPFAAHWVNVSLGIAQVRISTAMLVENEGYIEEATYYEWHGNNATNNRKQGIINNLLDPKENIRYAAAYLRYYQDRWTAAYPDIEEKTDILATLYNQGELYPPHDNPIPNPFGEFAEKNYEHARTLLGLK